MSLADDVISQLVDYLCECQPLSISYMYDRCVAEQDRILIELEASECYNDAELKDVRERLNRYPFLEFIKDTYHSKQLLK